MYPNPYTLHQYTPSTAFMPICINGWSCPFPNFRSELRALLVVLLLPDFCHFFWGSHLVQNGGVGGIPSRHAVLNAVAHSYHL